MPSSPRRARRRGPPKPPLCKGRDCLHRLLAVSFRASASREASALGVHTGVGIRSPSPPSVREVSRPKAVTEGEICRGIRGDAPQGYLFRFAPLRGHRPLRTVYRKRMRIPPGGQSRPPLHPVSQRQMHYQNQTSGQRPPPTFAASRQRRDLIIAHPPGGCFQRGRAAALPLWSLKDGGFSRGKEDRNFLPP